jgi:hypothetical protein
MSIVRSVHSSTLRRKSAPVGHHTRRESCEWPTKVTLRIAIRPVQAMRKSPLMSQTGHPTAGPYYARFVTTCGS